MACINYIDVHAIRRFSYGSQGVCRLHVVDGLVDELDWAYFLLRQVCWSVVPTCRGPQCGCSAGILQNHGTEHSRSQYVDTRANDVLRLDRCSPHTGIDHSTL